MRHFGDSTWAVALLAGSIALAGAPRETAACGCFAPPNPSVPVVQAGENILFAVTGGQVTAHIQIQYSGDAKDFGWLLPLPSVPTLEVGSDEVFRALAATTRPYYRENVIYPADCGWPRSTPDFGSLAFDSPDLGDANGGGGPGGPLVIQGGIGPYDYAVLKADSKQDMLDWLAKNRYFIPAGTDDVVGPYIHPGGYFLALKLMSGKATGDIQPIVVHYASDFPMIPLVLTSVTSTPNLGIWVWLLADARAVPRNYYHVVPNDALLNWDQVQNAPGLPSNYEEVVGAAIRSAPTHHAFVTELAAPTKSIKKAIFPAGQFGDLAELRKVTWAGDYLTFLRSNGYTFSSALITILQKHIKQPAELMQFNGGGGPVTADSYYWNFDFWYRTQPDAFKGFNLSFNPVALTDEIEATIVKPVRTAATLFDSAPYLTRLHGWLAPVDMTRDPVFSFNPFLPDVDPSHVAKRTMYCGKQPWTWTSSLATEQGFVIDEAHKSLPKLPAALRIEILRDSGLPEVVTDNTEVIRGLLGQSSMGPGDGSGEGTPAVGGGGCNVGDRDASPLGRGLVALAVVLGLAMAGSTLRRRRRR